MDNTIPNTNESSSPLRVWAANAVNGRHERAKSEYERCSQLPGVVRHDDGVIEVPDGQAILLRALRHIIRANNTAVDHMDRSWFRDGFEVLCSIIDGEFLVHPTPDEVLKFIRQRYAETHQ